LKQSFLPIFGGNIYKNFKKRYFYTFLIKNKYKNIFFRKFYRLNNLIYKYNKKSIKFSKEMFKKKAKKKKSYRLLKKLKTFYYRPDIKRTRKKVFNHFKKKVLRKFSRRNKRKIHNIYTGLKFNLFNFNFKNRYKNRMKDLELKKKSTPRFFFFKKKKNLYININKDIMKVNYKQLPYFIIKRYKLEKKNKKYYFKR